MSFFGKLGSVAGDVWDFQKTFNPMVAAPTLALKAFGFGGSGGSSTAPTMPTSPNYSQLAQGDAAASQANTAAQTAANRINTSNPYASTTFNPDGSMSNQFTGQMGQANDAAQQSLLAALRSPIQDGQQARDQAISAAYGQATSRLDPMWNQREDATRTRLLNQGLDPSSAASGNEMQAFGFGRNDAYGSAMNSAIQQGTAAGDSVFRNSLMAKQLPMQQLQGMQGLLSQPGYALAGRADSPNSLAAGVSQGNFDLGLYGIQNQAEQAKRQAEIDKWSGILGFGGDLLKAAPGIVAMSDERAKQNIQRHGIELLPGVPLATWEYKHTPGTMEMGVIAQDLEKVAPRYVLTAPDGMKWVDYSFLGERDAA